MAGNTTPSHLGCNCDSNKLVPTSSIFLLTEPDYRIAFYIGCSQSRFTLPHADRLAVQFDTSYRAQTDMANNVGERENQIEESEGEEDDGYASSGHRSVAKALG